MSVTRIDNEAVKLRAENKKLKADLAKMQETAQTALVLIEQYKMLLTAVNDKIQMIRGDSNVNTRGSNAS